MTLRHFGLAATLAATLALATPAYAVTEIQWWHAMTGPNNDVVVKLANDFNASQGYYKIVPSFKGSYADVLNAGIAAFRAGNAPGIMQVFEVERRRWWRRAPSGFPNDEGAGEPSSNPICRRHRLPLNSRGTCCRFRSPVAWCCGSTR